MAAGAGVQGEMRGHSGKQRPHAGDRPDALSSGRSAAAQISSQSDQGAGGWGKDSKGGPRASAPEPAVPPLLPPAPQPRPASPHLLWGRRS